MPNSTKIADCRIWLMGSIGSLRAPSKEPGEEASTLIFRFAAGVMNEHWRGPRQHIVRVEAVHCEVVTVGLARRHGDRGDVEGVPSTAWSSSPIVRLPAGNQAPRVASKKGWLAVV